MFEIHYILLAKSARRSHRSARNLRLVIGEGGQHKRRRQSFCKTQKQVQQRCIVYSAPDDFALKQRDTIEKKEMLFFSILYKSACCFRFKGNISAKLKKCECALFVFK